MTKDEIQEKYTRVEKWDGKHSLWFKVDHQSFCIDRHKKKKEIEWMQEMLVIALERLIIQVQTDKRVVNNTEILQAIAELNEEFFNNTSEDYTGLVYQSDGYSHRVSFMGIRIWTDCDDRRTFDEETNTYEPLISCFRREALSILKALRNVNLEVKG